VSVTQQESVYPIHTAVKGRARFRVHGLFQESEIKEAIESSLQNIEGIYSASANIFSANVLILFQPDKSLDEVIAALKDVIRDAKVASKKKTHKKAPQIQPLRLPQIIQGFVHRSLKHQQKFKKQSTGIEFQDHWHEKNVEQVLQLLQTELETGLSQDDADRRLKKYGHNALPQTEPRSALRILVSQFANLPMVLLIGSSFVSVLTGGIIDAIAIVVVIILNATIGTTTEHRSEKTITSLSKISLPPATVFRDGSQRKISAEDVVIGDLLVLTRESYVAADARLLEAHGLTIDESVLTGESVPVQKSTPSLNRSDMPLAERTNMVYRGTIVTGGSGLAVVVGTGMNTEIGNIQELVTTSEQPETPLQKQLIKLGRQLIAISALVCGGMFMIGLLRRHPWIEMLNSSIALAIAAIPEGLPTVATATLAYGVKQMREENVLIRHLKAIESLGALQVLCLDKTGTITLNRMSVRKIIAGMKKYDISRKQILHGGKHIVASSDEDLFEILKIMTLCAEEELDPENMNGSATEGALLQVAVDSEIDINELRLSHPIKKIDLRREGRNYMKTEHELPHGKVLHAVKGNPLEVLDLCTRYRNHGRIDELDDTTRKKIKNHNDALAGQAFRVLGVAYKENQNGQSDSELIWLGMIGLLDPPREGLKEIIQRFKKAGIRTIMLTGDQSKTALAIAKELDLSGGEEIEMVDSTELESMPPEKIEAIAHRAHVFSRVNPSNKLHIVQALQKAGKVVAMTGDGINDGPALKAADIGIAMGKGAELAQEVADVILLDNDVRRVLIAIEQGRTIHDDLKKSVRYIAATNLSEIVVMLSSVISGFRQPLNPRQLLWINLLTDVFPELALAIDPPETDVMNRPPRDNGVPIVNSEEFKRIFVQSAIMTATSLGSYGIGTARYGLGKQASTMAFVTLSLSQLLHTISARSENITIFNREKLPENKYVPMAVGTGFAIELFSEFIQPLRRLLGTSRIGITDWLICGGGALFSFIINEGLKLGRNSGRLIKGV
jgi:Ca2+-transporting ATPase